MMYISLCGEEPELDDFFLKVQVIQLYIQERNWAPDVNYLRTRNSKYQTSTTDV